MGPKGRRPGPLASRRGGVRGNADADVGPDADAPVDAAVGDADLVGDADVDVDTTEEECAPDCAGRCCGSDGCGGECEGPCGEQGRCDEGTCQCFDSSCGQERRHPECESQSPAPEEPDEVEAFVTTNAIPLQCLDEDAVAWDFSIFESDLEGMSLFMFGEVHGSMELGPLSADLFEFLVRQGLVNALALEFVMDATDEMNGYLQTGEGPLVTRYRFNRYSPNDFMRLLLERARALVEEGFELTAFAVDYPWDLQDINDQIMEIAEGCAEEQRAAILDRMPAAPAGLAPAVSEDFVQEAEAYHEHLVDDAATICADLTELGCERLQMLARALWIGAYAASGMMSTATDAEFIEFLIAREQLIYFNYRVSMTTGDERVYAHMGSAHALKGASEYGFDTTAYRLDAEYPLTSGRVYTTRPDTGPGSAVAHWGTIEPVWPEYEFLAEALEDAVFDTFAVPTFQPGLGCVANPLAGLDVSGSTVECGSAYDSIVFVRLLTPDGGSKSAQAGISPELERALGARAFVRAHDERLGLSAPSSSRGGESTLRGNPSE